jgi:hypothetical protein
MNSSMAHSRNGGLANSFVRHLWPFGLFKDASRGTRLERAAAYRHNRRMRTQLPVYLKKWLLSCSIALLFTARFGELAAGVDSTVNAFLLIAASFGVVFTLGVCVMFVLTYAYLYLTYNDH